LPSGTYKRPGRAYEVSGEAEKLIGPRRVMARMMAKANAEICHTPLFDEVDISAWPKGTDITVRIMRSIVAAAMVEPAINAWYDHGEGDEGPSKTIHRHVSLGMAVDSPRGLFVPVLQNLESLSPAQMRAELDRHRKAIGDGSIAPRDMSGATITLSNFGMLAGRFAAPIISAPEVAIVGIGGLYDKLVMSGGTIENHRFMPVSLTFDHRGATGGEAARFLRGILDDLELAH
jgi:pyruvate dehydrogenase E2 component (dihydrolipoamide acetyltransferase)